MNDVAVIEVGREAMIVILKISAPIMIAGTVIGLVIALFQALTTIQEMTLTFVPKLLIMSVTFLMTLPLMGSALAAFSADVSRRIIGG